ncbi:zinc transporter ZIP4 [Neosynchiropus ocellatus]
MASSVPLSLCLFVSCIIWGSVTASAVQDQVYQSVVSVVSPGQQRLTRESLGLLFNTLEKRVQCGEVPCVKCDLADAVQQLTPSIAAGSVSTSEFPALAAGSIFYLTAPGPVCAAAGQGKWAEETERFLHRTAHGAATAENHAEEELTIAGLERIVEELKVHYTPSSTEGCVSADEIMTEAGAVSLDQSEPVGLVLGWVLYHALDGRCFTRRSLPEESFFLDDIMVRVGSQNFTLHVMTPTLSEFLLQYCFTAEELTRIYGLEGNNSGLGRSGLARLSPALVQQIMSGACSSDEHLTPDELTEAERYLYATLANVVITLLSMFGIVLLLCTTCAGAFQICIQFAISLAVGSLTGDALLHLVPMFLGLHVHSDETTETGRSGEHGHVEPADYTYKMLVLVAAIYLFYLMEAIFSLITTKGHHHHHEEEQSEPHHCDHGRVLEMYQREKKRKYKLQSTSKVELFDDEDQEKSHQAPHARTQEQRLLPVMITLGDGIHNFADGLAIGAAFSMSWKSGLATSVAVLCHELPHELGDFAILLNCGMSVRRALLLNVGSAMTSFVGLYIGLSVATDIATKQWIAAVTAGMFLYVGLADMLPTLVHINSKRPWFIFLLQNIGLLSGWAFLLLLSLYEEKISF